VGRLLELPEFLVTRHPFPGPGLAIRCLCFDKNEDRNVSESQKKAEKFCSKFYKNISCAVLPVKSVGLQGDGRTYAHPMVIWGEKNWKKLDEISSHATNTLREINRVVLLLNPSKENKFSYSLPNESLFVTPERIDLVRQIDKIVYDNVKEAGLYNKIWEIPIVVIPIVDDEGRESIVLRPFNSRDVLTLNFYPMTQNVLKKIMRDILATGKVFYVFYDITNKPPGTTEWE
jgi:GMP synthase (glutamine-hydrolysing)